jgi:hypothetical protein
MSTIFVAVVLVGLVAAVCILLVSLDKKQKRKVMRELHLRFSRLGTENKLTFSSQEALKDLLIGLDGIQRKLLVLKRQDNNTFHSFAVDLGNVKSCSVKKYYGTINSGGLKTKKLEQYLEKITLHFEFAGGSPAKEILFYKHFDHHLVEIPELEQKARHWELMLSKLLTPTKKVA